MAPATRNERRREATKRQIMGLLDDSGNKKVEEAVMSKARPEKPTKGLVSKDLVGSNPDHVRLLIEDIENQLKQNKEIITAEANTGKQEQQQVHFSGLMKLKKEVKKMTVREFNQTYSCDLLQLLMDVGSSSAAGKKRNHRAMDMETPAPAKGRKGMKTPATTSRTVRRGEQVFSKNGSPVDHIEEGALVATVTKKRRGNKTSIAMIDLNVGDGRYINLDNPGTMEHLDDSMKNTAISQLKVLQDQMASLMAQLTN